MRDEKLSQAHQANQSVRESVVSIFNTTIDQLQLAVGELEDMVDSLIGDSEPERSSYIPFKSLHEIVRTCPSHLDSIRGRIQDIKNLIQENLT